MKKTEARRHFNDARSLIQAAERLEEDGWDSTELSPLIRAASKAIDEASKWFYPERGADRGGAK